MQFAYAECIPEVRVIQENTRRHVPLKAVPHLILLLLAEQSTYGVELLARLEERSGGTIRLNPGSLYRFIARLVDDGLIAPLKTEAVGANGSQRKLYGVTELGRAALRAEAERQAELLTMAEKLNLFGGRE